MSTSTFDRPAADAGDHVSRRNIVTNLLGGLGVAALFGCSAESSGSEAGAVDEVASALTGSGTLKVADTAANLRTIPGGSTLAIAVLQGINAASDGGGGVFYWSTTAMADDGWSALNSGGGYSAGWRRTNPGCTMVDSVSALRALAGGASRAVAVLTGYTTPGDGAGGVFFWSATNTADDGGTILNAGGLGSSSAGWRRIFTGPLDVRWYGAKGNGSTVDDAAVSAAINRANAFGQGAIHFPAGNYLLTGAWTISSGGVHLSGDGPDRTIITYNPSVAGSTCFTWAASSMLFRGSLRNLTMTSTTSIRRTAIEIYDVSEFRLERANVTTWLGSGSTALWTHGRELLSVVDCVLSGDLPLRISPNNHPGPGVLDLDHGNFHNLYLVGNGTATATSACITIDDGVVLGPVSFTGHQAWVGGKGGLYWDDQNSPALSQTLSISNLRYEQGGTPAGGYAVYMSKTKKAHSGFLHVSDFIAGNGADYNGLYLRGVGHRLENCLFQGTPGSVGMNIDGSCCPAMHSVCWLNINGASVTLNQNGSTGALEVFSTPMASDAQPRFAIYDTESRAAEFRYVKTFGKRVTSGTAPPSVGTWFAGDVSWNSAPTAGGSAGWICTTAGTPGTWTPMLTGFSASAVLTPGTIANGASFATAISVPGASPGDKVIASWIGTLISNGVFVVANAGVANIVVVTVVNLSGAAVTIPQGTAGVTVLRQ